MYMLGQLEEQGGLKNFTALAEAVIRVDESMQLVDDPKASMHVSRMLDHVFVQAYQGEKPMGFLAERVESVLEVLDLVRLPEPGPMTEPEREPDSADDPWQAEAPTHVRASACQDEDDVATTVWRYSGSTDDGLGDGSPL